MAAEQRIHARQAHPEFGFGPCARLRSQRPRFGQRCSGRGVCVTKMFGFGAAAQQDAQAHTVRNFTQQHFAGIEAAPRFDQPTLTGVQPAQVAKDLALRTPVGKCACDCERGFVAGSCVIVTALRLVHKAEIA